MNLYTQELIENMAAKAWKSYAMIRRAVDAIEAAGLSIDGGTKDGLAGAGALFGAMTACCDIVRISAGIRPGTRQSEGLDELIAGAAGEYGPTDDIPRPVKAGIYALAMEQADEKPGTGGKDYEVTVAMTGGISVRADSSSGAMAIVDGLASQAIARLACWDDPSATDADLRD